MASCPLPEQLDNKTKQSGRMAYNVTQTTMSVDALATWNVSPAVTGLDSLAKDAVHVTSGNSRYVYIALTPFLTIFIVAGNILTIAAVAQNHNMQTLTNGFVVSLSVADLLVGASVPFYVAIQTVENAEGIQMARTNRAACLSSLWTMQITVTASVLNLLAIAVERYLAVFKPLRYASVVTKGRVQISVTLIWTLAVAVSLPPVLGWNRWEGDEIEDCGFVDVFPRQHLLLLYVLPVASCLLALTVVYIVIFVTAYQQQRRLLSETISVTQSQGKNTKREMKITKMLATVVGIFYACWCPYLLLTLVLLELEGSSSMTLQRVYAYSKYVVVLNSGMNPLIYGLRNRDFRNAYRRLFGCTVNNNNDWVSSRSGPGPGPGPGP